MTESSVEPIVQTGMIAALKEHVLSRYFREKYEVRVHEGMNFGSEALIRKANKFNMERQTEFNKFTLGAIYFCFRSNCVYYVYLKELGLDIDNFEKTECNKFTFYKVVDIIATVYIMKKFQYDDYDARRYQYVRSIKNSGGRTGNDLMEFLKVVNIVAEKEKMPPLVEPELVAEIIETYETCDIEPCDC